MTHWVGSSELQPLSVDTAVPSKVRRTALRLGADLGASLLPVCNLGSALDSPIPGTSLAVERSPGMAVYLPSWDVNNGLMKTESPHHDPMEKEFDFI